MKKLGRYRDMVDTCEEHNLVDRCQARREDFSGKIVGCVVSLSGNTKLEAGGLSLVAVPVD